MHEAVERFLPFSFDAVNQIAAEFLREDGRAVYSTPKSYLELLKHYRDGLQRKREESASAIDRLSSGVRKLNDTAAAVSIIEEELSEKKCWCNCCDRLSFVAFVWVWVSHLSAL